MNLLLFLLASAGATYILVYGKIFKTFREAMECEPFPIKLFRCPLCCGFWIGFAMHLLFLDCDIELPGSYNPLTAFFIYGPAAAIVSYIAGVIVNDHGLRITFGHVQVNYTKPTNLI